MIVQRFFGEVKRNDRLGLCTFRVVERRVDVVFYSGKMFFFRKKFNCDFIFIIIIINSEEYMNIFNEWANLLVGEGANFGGNRRHFRRLIRSLLTSFHRFLERLVSIVVEVTVDVAQHEFVL